MTLDCFLSVNFNCESLTPYQINSLLHWFRIFRIIRIYGIYDTVIHSHQSYLQYCKDTQQKEDNFPSISFIHTHYKFPISHILHIQWTTEILHFFTNFLNLGQFSKKLDSKNFRTNLDISYQYLPNFFINISLLSHLQPSTVCAEENFRPTLNEMNEWMMMTMV